MVTIQADPLASQNKRTFRWLNTAAVGQTREYSSTFLTEFSVMGAQIIAYKLAARLLGKTGFAEYALARRTISIVYPIVLLGLGVGLSRYIANASGRGDEESKAGYLGATLWCVGFSLLVCVALMNAYPSRLAYLFFGSREYESLVMPLSLVVAGSTLHAIVYSYFRGMLEMVAANVMQLINFGLMPLAVFFFYSKSIQSLLSALGIYSFIVAGLALLFFTPWKAIANDNRRQVKELLRFGIQRVPGDFILMAMFALPATIVAHKTGIRTAGFIAFGISMLNLIGSFFSPFGLILLPKAGALLAAGRSGELRRQVWLLTKVTLVVSTVITVGIAISAKTLMRLYLGSEFIEGTRILQLLLLAAVPYSLYTVLRNVIDAFHELGVTTMILAAGFGIFCLGSTVLFPAQNHEGAVLVAFLCGVITLCLLAGAESWRILRFTSRTTYDR